MTNVLDEIEAQSVERQKAAADAYWRLAKSIARGQRPPANVHHLLDDAGKSTADLRAAVALIEKRFVLAAQLAAAPGLAVEQKSLAAKDEAALVALRQAQEVYRNVVAPIQNRMAEIESATLAAENARRRLIDACPYPAVADPLAEVRQQITLAENKRAAIERLNQTNAARIRELTDQDGAHYVGMDVNGSKAAAREKEAAAIKIAIPENQKEIDAIDVHVVALRAEESKLIEAALEP
jgi:hypothetical protein